MSLNGFKLAAFADESDNKFSGQLDALVRNGLDALEMRNVDVILERFSPDELGIIMDTYWVQKGGADPIEWLHKLSGRVDAIHYKDMFWNGDMAPIGEGNMNFEGIISASEKVGIEHILVEQDNCNGEDPFDCLARSYKYLTSLGLK